MPASPHERAHELILATRQMASERGMDDIVRALAELEDRVDARTAELAAANRDLRAFAHLAAHDLRTPLLTAASYIDLAMKYEAGRLSVEGRKALEGAQEANEQMSRLIDAILEYSTLTTSQVSGAPVDLNACVARVLSDLNALITQSGAEISVEDLPSVSGSEALLERALQNLIVNALNYGDPERPVVMVCARYENDGAVRISVIDNGSGVPERERDEIFEMFTRGSRGLGREGFGIGLAFVARIMEKHGGTVSVDGKPDGGAAFHLTFPPA